MNEIQKNRQIAPFFSFSFELTICNISFLFEKNQYYFHVIHNVFHSVLQNT